MKGSSMHAARGALVAIALLIAGCGNQVEPRRAGGHLGGPGGDQLESPLALEVYTDTGGYRSLGKMPAAAPIIIPPGAHWWVEPLGASESALRALGDEVARLGIPGLRIFVRTSRPGEKLSDTGLAHLSGLTGLRELQLHSDALTDGGLSPLATLTGLTWLSLHMTKISDAGMVHLAPLAQLEELTVPTGITAAGLAHLPGSHALKRIYLASASDRELAALAPFTRLERLNVGGGGLTDAGLASLKALTALKDLRVSGEGITDKGLVSLARLVGLQRLDVPNTALTDAGLEVISGFKQLERLDLRGTRIGARGAGTLLALTRLKCLNLRGCASLDDATVAKLRAGLPQARILYTGADGRCPD